MRLLHLIPALSVAGCAATMTPAEQVSNYDLCAYTMRGGNNAIVAQQEVNRRGLDCRPYYQAINAQSQREAAALQNAANYFAPRPIARPMVNCTSQRIGNTVSTDCF